MGLLGELKKYVKDALPGGLLNPEVNTQGILDGAALSTTAVPVLGDLLGLGADLHRYKNEPESRTLGNFALSGLGMLPFVPAMTAWHGSPHKFDKFSLDKIGTGEGAQAYGHGLYLAEHPATAEVYASKLANGGAMPMPPIPHDFMVDGARYVKQSGGMFKQVGDSADLIPVAKSEYGAALTKAQDVYGAKSKAGNLYKTDIPDEAVARFLDWDKPLSQQAPEVQAALQRAAEIRAKQTGGAFGPLDMGIAGKDVVPTLGEGRLKQAGIHGIRYLDGGSRSAGQGSSNFVVFDDQLPRILERNGVPTGQQPWKPGEWQGLLGR